MSITLSTETAASVQRGLEQSAAGQVEDLGDFSQYAQSQEERFEAEAIRVYELKLRAEAAKADFEEADKKFRRDLEDAGLLNEDTKGFGPIHTSIYPTKRFDAKLAEQVVEDLVKRHRITRREAESCFRTVLDAKSVEAVVSPADYERMKKTSGTTVKYSLDK